MTRRVHARPRETLQTFTCTVCSHPVWVSSVSYNPVVRHADPRQAADCSCPDSEGCFPNLAEWHNPHKCLACDGSIGCYEHEVRVPGAGNAKHITRYMHATPDQCRASISRDWGPRVVSGGSMGSRR